MADYRGYGTSGGSPTFRTLVQDAHRLFLAVKGELSLRDFQGDLWVMGRSMGSISALELAYHYPDEMRGIIIESGFASVTRLIRHLRLPSFGINLEPIEQERLPMIKRISVPALIIHGEFDTLVPLQEAKDLFAYLGSSPKELVIIPGADHNSVMFAGGKKYFAAIQKFMEKTK